MITFVIKHTGKLSKKDLHITSGNQGKAILSESQFVNKDQGDILGFTDLLSLGPLYNLDKQGSENRKLWFKNAFCWSTDESDYSFVDDDLIQVKTLLETIHNYKTLYLWLGNTACEKLTTARILHHLKGLDITILQVDFSKTDFKSDRGVSLNSSSLQDLKSEDVPELAKYFSQLGEHEKQSASLLWTSLQKDKSIYHLFDKQNNCVSGEESFLDKYLLNRCIEQNNSSRVVAYTLWDIWQEWGAYEIGDSLLFCRLNALEKQGKVTITDRNKDPERGQVLFQVKAS